MADADETYEIGVEVTGIEAAQQAMAALGIDPSQDSEETAAGEPGEATSSSSDLSGLLAAQERTNELLAEILEAIRGQPKPSEATY